ncbi:MAG: Na+/H+ antiporter, partial [Nonomuraea sp.]|nr:Na+/H+ antiporter [Nonomuraea sp.]
VPDRELIIVIAVAVILVTLVAQGLTLPWLVRTLGVTADTAAERALERDLAMRAARAARKRLREINEAEDLPDEVVEALSRRAVDVGMRISPEAADQERREAWEQRAERFRAMRRVLEEMMSAARQAVLDACRDPSTDPAVVNRVLRELDARSLR